MKNAKQLQTHGIFSPYGVSDSDPQRHWQDVLIIALSIEVSLHPVKPLLQVHCRTKKAF